MAIQLPFNGFRINTSGIAGTVNTILMIVIIATIGYFIYTIFSYNKKVMLFRRTASGWKVYGDRGRFRKVMGVLGIHLLRRRLFLPLPESDQTFIVGRSELIFYEWKSDTQLIPLELKHVSMMVNRIELIKKKFTPEEQELIRKFQGGFKSLPMIEAQQSQFEAIPSTIHMWAAHAARRKIEEHKKVSWIQQWFPLIGVGVVAAAFFLTVILIMDKFTVLQGTADSLNSAAESVDNAANKLANVGVQTLSTKPPTQQEQQISSG